MSTEDSYTVPPATYRLKLQQFKLPSLDDLSDVMRMLMVSVAIIISTIIVYVAYGNPDAQTKNFNYYMVGAILPVFFALYVSVPMFREKQTMSSMLGYIGFIVIFLVTMYLFSDINNPKSVSILTGFLGFFQIVAILLGMAIVFRIFQRYITTMRGWMGFLFQFLFFIPCLLLDFIESIFGAMKQSSPSVVVLFILEILLILGYLYLPRWMASFYTVDRIVLLKDPIFLNRSRIVSEPEHFFLSRTDKKNPTREQEKDIIRQNYSIDFWVHINSMSNVTNLAYSKPTPILCYGAPGLPDTGKPCVKYYSGKFEFYLFNDNNKIVVNVDPQKWNYVAVTYTDSHCYIYLNGVLEQSVAVTSTPAYSTTDVIEVGFGDGSTLNGGLYGGICQVSYHRTPLKDAQITAIYNVNRFNNPPTDY
jgi:hypothetical protein